MLASAQTIKSAGTRHRPLEQRQRFISTMRAQRGSAVTDCALCAVVSFFQRYLARNALQAPRPAPAPRARAGSDRQRRRLAVSERVAKGSEVPGRRGSLGEHRGSEGRPADPLDASLATSLGTEGTL